jgi:hypothetical protein
MRSRRTPPLVLLVVLACGWWWARSVSPAAGQAPPDLPPPAEVPRLDIEAPPRYHGEAGRLRWLPRGRLRAVMDLVGVAEAGAPIRVVLAPEDHELARAVPPGISGYAVPARDLAVLLPDRVPRYPHDSLEVLFLHEATHLLVARATGGREVPRWFNEGVALLASRGWSLGDRSRVVIGGVSGIPADTGELEEAFYGRSYEIETAYALAGALVHHLVQRHGRELIAATLAGVAAGEAFEEAFARAAGVQLTVAEAGFWRRYRLWYRWLPFLTSGAALWMGITALALLAAARRRQRDAAIRRRWEEEERLGAMLAAVEAEAEAVESEETVH